MPSCAGRGRLALGGLSEDHYTELPRRQAPAEWAYFVEYYATFGGKLSAKRLKSFIIHVYFDFGRLALDGMSKNSTVEGIRVAASARMGGVSVRGIYSNGRFVDGKLTVAELFFGETMAERLVLVLGEECKEEKKDSARHASGPERGQQNRFVRCPRTSMNMK